MKKVFLVIFLFFALYSLSFADNWEPILKIGPILDKDLDLLSKRSSELSNQININLAKEEEISKLLSSSISDPERGKLELEWGKLSNEWEKLNSENTLLTNLQLALMTTREAVFVIESLLSYNKDLKGSKIIKGNIKSIIKSALTLIEKYLEKGKELKFSYETIEVFNNVKSDLEKILEILK
jgi:hypothetical protein